jgi:sugar-specific transcriptional regulator TrmB
MDTPDEHVSTLVELGLSQSQATVYLALVKSKDLTAQTIHTISGVARPDVYRVLGELEDAGLVEKIISKPEKFHAISAKECVSTLLQRRIRKTQQLKKEALKLVQALREKTAHEEPDDKCGLILISGRDAVYAKTEKMMKSAQERICFLGLTRRMLAWLPKCSSSLEEALARKVDCRMIMPKPKKDLWEPLKSLEKHPNFDLRLIPGSPKTAFSVWDRKEILMTTSATDTATPAPVLWSNNKSIVNLCQDHFECQWRKAEKASLNKD